MKELTILGSTGSIGTQALDIISNYPQEFYAKYLTAGSNVQLLAKQAMAFSPKAIAIFDESKYLELKSLLPKYSGDILVGEEAITALASNKVDLTIAAIVGIAGLASTYAAIEAGNDIALANKESLVCAGSLMLKKAKEHNVKILPVDSEHSAMFQCWEEHNKEQIDHIILTASGGPFLGYKKENLQNISVEQAVAHPNWSMGRKISIDSATLMNKSLELIEACFLFNCQPEFIKVVVHPQSIIHSAVAYKDGSIVAHLGNPDMRTPISVAMGYPKRLNLNFEILDLVKLAKMTFEHVDDNAFPTINLAKQCFAKGQEHLIALNSANEEAVYAFLNEEISFLDIFSVISEVLNRFNGQSPNSLADVFAINKIAKDLAANTIKKIKKD